MTTVKAFIRTGRKDKEVNVRFRLSDGRDVQLFHKSEFMVLPTLWDAKNEQYKAKSLVKLEERTLFNASISERKKIILSLYGGDKSLTSDKLEKLIDEHLHPEKYDVIVHTIAGLPASTLGMIASTKSCTLGREDLGKAPSSVILL